jgi:hypothetical protein
MCRWPASTSSTATAKSPYAAPAAMHHLGIGAARANTAALILIHPDTVEVIDPATGEHLSSHTIDAHRSYCRNTRRSLGRWPRPL